MKTKVLISALILCSFFVVSVNVVTAWTSDPITDPTGDVFDVITGENITTKPHLDIKELVCERDYRKVTLKLTLEGSVKDQGDVRFLDQEYLFELNEKLENGEITMEEITALFTQIQISYIINIETLDINDLETPDNAYLVYYVNKDVLVFGDENNLEASSQVVNGNILTISFNLPSSKENLTFVEAFSSEGSLLDIDEAGFSDELIGTELNDPLITNGNGNGDGGNGGNGSPGFELIPLLIAIFIGILLLKRKRSR